jgi:hypothetical protein
MHGATFDTGALIALERRGRRMRTVLLAATASRVPITVPVAVLAEWWRGRTDVREEILEAVHVEPMHAALAKAAGEALAAVRGSTVEDAIVMASAALRGDVVYTADYDDLERLRQQFPGVRLLSV